MIGMRQIERGIENAIIVQLKSIRRRAIGPKGLDRSQGGGRLKVRLVESIFTGTDDDGFQKRRQSRTRDSGDEFVNAIRDSPRRRTAERVSMSWISLAKSRIEGCNIAKRTAM